MTRFLRLLFFSLTLLVTACSLAALTGCRTQQTASSSSQHTVSRADTLRAVTLRSDTFRIHDSVYIREQTIGCTIRIEQHHWHTAWQTRTLRDTVCSLRYDTLRVVETSERVRSPTSVSPIIGMPPILFAVALFIAVIIFLIKHKDG